jgi:zinc/manganese transport system ATP-binding protein
MCTYKFLCRLGLLVEIFKPYSTHIVILWVEQSVHEFKDIPMVRLDSVHVSFNGVRALDSISLELRGPGIIQVLGPNGAGKSTLLKVIAGLIRPVRGSVYVNGVDVTGRSDVAGMFVAYMPQSNEPPGWSPLTVWEFVETSVLTRKARWPRFVVGGVRGVVERCLSMVGVPRGSWYLRLSELSGGMFQRVLIASVLVTGAPIMLLDEPLASVDPEGRVALSRVLSQLATDRLVVVTSHDPHPLLEHTRLVVALNKRVVAIGDPHEVLSRLAPGALYPYWVSEHGH